VANQKGLGTFADGLQLTHHLSLASLQHGKGQIRADDILSEGTTAQVQDNRSPEDCRNQSTTQVQKAKKAMTGQQGPHK